VLESVDLAARRLGYFHNAGYFTLEGEDFVELFRLDAAADPEFMPMFAELVRCDRARHQDAQELRDNSRELLRKHIQWRPQVNPIPKFRERFERDLPELSRQGMGAYHAWVFGTLRQLGAAAELAALYLRWLVGDPEGRPAQAANSFLETSIVCKSLVLKVARAVNSRRALDASASFEELTSSWELASLALRDLS
jgi:Domain of unknown function (DUF1839)